MSMREREEVRQQAFPALALFSLSILALSGLSSVHAQTAPGLIPRDNPSQNHSVFADLEKEEPQGPYIFYTQEYLSGGKFVSLHGSIYTGIAAVHHKGCDLSFETVATDHFSGRKGKKPVHDTWTRYRYSAHLQLSPEIAESLRVVAARPIQLQTGTYATCGPNHGCAIHWIEIRSPKADIKLHVTTDDVADFDGPVTAFDGMTNRFLLPTSSPAAGERIAADLRDFARTCQTPRTAPSAP